MLKKLQLTNFQSHENTTVDLHPGVNVIVGSSDSGKSALVRGLRWLVFNRPMGMSFRSHWAKKEEVRVTGETSDGHTVTRFRGNSTNGYLLDGAELTANGTEPPLEVRNTLNLDEDNFQGQLDSPYLLTLNGGQVAKELNAIAHLEVIDGALSRCRKGLMDVSRETQRVKEELAGVGRELVSYETLPDTVARRDALVVLYHTWTQTEQDLNQLETTLDQIREVLPLTKKRSTVQSYTSRLEKLNRLSRELREQQVTAVGLEKELREAREARELMGSVNPKQVKAGLTTLEKLDHTYGRLRVLDVGKVTPLKGLLQTVTTWKKELGEARDIQSQLKKQVDDLSKQQAKSICPTCKRPL